MSWNIKVQYDSYDYPDWEEGTSGIDQSKILWILNTQSIVWQKGTHLAENGFKSQIFRLNMHVDSGFPLAFNPLPKHFDFTWSFHIHSSPKCVFSKFLLQLHSISLEQSNKTSPQENREGFPNFRYLGLVGGDIDSFPSAQFTCFPCTSVSVHK